MLKPLNDSSSALSVNICLWGLNLSFILVITLGVTVWTISFPNHVILIIRQVKERELDRDTMKEWRGKAGILAILTHSEFVWNFGPWKSSSNEGKIAFVQKETNYFCNYANELWLFMRARSDEGRREPSRGIITPLVQLKKKTPFSHSMSSSSPIFRKMRGLRIITLSW